MRIRELACVALLLVVAGPTVAGVFEIDQACAQGDGCFPGDTAGFPVQITAPGSYRLTGNLDLTDENTTGIEIGASEVTIELGGFTIRGITTCSGDPVSCTPTGTGRGIDSLPLLSRASVRNGTVRNTGGTGIELGSNSLAVGVRVWSNGGDGLVLAERSVVSRCSAKDNLTRGIAVGAHSSVGDSEAKRNGTIGIYALSGSAVVRSVVHDSAHGVEVVDGVVAASAVRSNSISGFFLIGGVAGRSAAFDNDWGFRLQSGSGALSDVTARSNDDEGIWCDATQGYAGSNVSDGGLGTVVGGLPLDGNLCDGSATCP